MNAYCHHVGNIAASTPLYQQWQEKTIGNATDSIQIHEDNKKLFMDRWESVLPLYVESDFSYRRGTCMGSYEYKGDQVTKLK